MTRFIRSIVLLQALALALALAWADGAGAQGPTHDALLDAPRSVLPQLTLNSLAATRDRPLFAPDRRKTLPPPVPVVLRNAVASVKQQAPPARPRFELTGIVVNPADKFVFLRDPATSKSVSIRSGETVGRWRVLIDSNYSVTLTDGVKKFQLEMFTGPESRFRAVQ